MMQDDEKPYIVIVDGCSNGSHYAPKLKDQFRCLHVQSMQNPPDFYSKRFDPAAYERNFIYEGDVTKLLRQLDPYKPVLIIAGSEYGVDLTEALLRSHPELRANDLSVLDGRRNKHINAWLKPVVLQGEHSTLVPLSVVHCEALIEAVKDGTLWNLSYAMVPSPEQMREEINRRCQYQEEGRMLPFSVISNKTQQAIGMTAYCHPDHANKRLDIGWTWYATSYQRTALNTECKLMLLTHAFEVLQCIYVGFRADYLNQKSRQAIERLGAKLEGIIRNYSVLPNGNIRDMCFYSILPNEWPLIKTHLSWLLQAHLEG